MVPTAIGVSKADQIRDVVHKQNFRKCELNRASVKYKKHQKFKSISISLTVITVTLTNVVFVKQSLKTLEGSKLRSDSEICINTLKVVHKE